MPTEIRFYRATDKYGWLSNLYKCCVTMNIKDVGLIDFPSAEHAYQFMKAAKMEIRWWILEAPYPRIAAVVGHNLFHYDVTPGWNIRKVPWMRVVVHHKFEQNGDLRRRLLQLPDVPIVEASLTDSFWGIGRNGKGKNMLGKILMGEKKRLARRQGAKRK